MVAFREKLAGREEKILRAIDNALDAEDVKLQVEGAKLAMAYLYGRPGEATAQTAEPATPPKLEDVRAMMQAAGDA